jgi:hypothetical protein
LADPAEFHQRGSVAGDEYAVTCGGTLHPVAEPLAELVGADGHFAGLTIG